MDTLPPKLPPVELSRRHPRITTLRGPLLLGAGVLFLVLLLAGFIISTARQQARIQKAQAPQPQAAVPTLPTQTLAGIPKNYQQALTAKDASAAATSQTSAVTPVATPSTQPPQAIPLAVIPQAQPAVAPATPAVTPTPQPRTTPVPAPRAVTAPPAGYQKPQVSHWTYGGGEGKVAKTPFGDEKTGEEKAKSSPLLKEAQ